MGCSINACSALKDLLRHSSQLTSLHFYNNMSDSAGAGSIAEVTDYLVAMLTAVMLRSLHGCENRKETHAGV